LQKLKEKNKKLIDDIKATLDRFGVYCLSLEDVLEDIKDALVDKNQDLKIQSIGWMERYFDTLNSLT